MPETVTLRPAVVWDCPNCKASQFSRADDAADSVRCGWCLHEFEIAEGFPKTMDDWAQEEYSHIHHTPAGQKG